MTALLEVDDLTIRYEPRLGAPLTAVDHVSFSLEAGEFVGLIGESGCGKSTLGTAILALLSAPAKVLGGAVRLDGEDLLTMPETDLRRRRWRDVSTVFQSSMNSLNPVVRIRHAFRDVFAAHTDLDTKAADRRAAELLETVSIDPKFLDSYPHELSGGMRQRINLALALALEPRFVLLDEPTTGLDVVVQRTILTNIRKLQERLGFTVLFISHDMGTVLETSDRILVMYAGRVVESAASADLLREPQHPCSKALLGSYGDPRSDRVEISYLPGRPPDLRVRPAGCAFAERCPEAVAACRTIDPPLEPVGASLAACIVAAGRAGTGPLAGEVGERATTSSGPAFTRASSAPGSARAKILELRGVTKTFTRRRGLTTTTITAVDDVSLELTSGSVTALVGESGSGKSTIAKLLTASLAPTSGQVILHGEQEADVARLRGHALRAFRKDVQYVFQDPYAALNPAHTIGASLVQPVLSFEGLRGRAARDRVVELLERVGLTPGASYADRFPYQLSGGQRQRVVIARALAPAPRLLVADEPIASLDVSIRAEILELLDGLVERDGVGMLYITHDLLSARMIADDIVVLNRGRVVERGPALDVITDPQDAYTKELLAAVADPAALRG